MISEVYVNDTDMICNVQSIFNEFYGQKRELKNDFELNPYTRLFTYCEGNKVVGIVEINDIIDRYEIIYISVIDDYRRKHIATKLINYIVNLGIKNNVSNITLEVNKNNESAIGLYTNNGFIVKATRERYYDGIDGLLMERKLM